MMITDRMATAIAAILSASSLPHSPEVQTGVSVVENTEEVARVVVNGLTSERYKTFPGIFDVGGEVAVYLDITETAAEEKFDAITNAIRQVIGAKLNMPAQIKAQDRNLTVVLFNHTGDENFNNGTRLGARFMWTARASQDPHNPN